MAAQEDRHQLATPQEARREIEDPIIPADKELYQRQIEATDAEIDALVYELYGLKEEEWPSRRGRLSERLRGLIPLQGASAGSALAAAPRWSISA